MRLTRGIATPEQRRHIVQQWHDSPMTMVAFCRVNSLSKSTLSYWMRAVVVERLPQRCQGADCCNFFLAESTRDMYCGKYCKGRAKTLRYSWAERKRRGWVKQRGEARWSSTGTTRSEDETFGKSASNFGASPG
jgi:hypothetical protein